MLPISLILSELKQLLIDHCDFRNDLFEDNYHFGDGNFVDWAGFVHRPFDARSACVAAFTLTGDSHAEVLSKRRSGAPIFFAVGNQHYEVWRPGRDDAVKVGESFSTEGIVNYVQEHKSNFSRNRLYQAKTEGRLPESDRQLPLFVDPGVLLYAETELGGQLTGAVVDAIRVLTKDWKQVTDRAIKAAFRLLAAKILKDKQVPRFKSADLRDVQKSLQRVEKHYGSHDPLTISSTQLKRLEGVVDIFNRLGDLRNLTPETLADVYEQALVTKEIRSTHGTHKTPSYLVDYIVWQLADWIAEIPVEQLCFFEPACGHAPFLVSAMRLIRTMDIDLPTGVLMKDFLRERLLGVENDAFALEIARLSLTVADEPNPDGWKGLREADMFDGDYLKSTASTSTVLFANPPYEESKAQRFLECTLPNLPVGGVFGVVIPATFLFSDKKRPTELREWLVRNYQLGEVSLYPDGIFEFADHECTVLLGRRLPSKKISQSVRTRLRRVREQDREGFQKDYKFTTSRISPQSQFAEQPNTELWIPEFTDEIWAWLRHLPKLESIATIGKGLEYKGKGKPKDARTVEDQSFRASVEGFDHIKGNWLLHEHPKIRYFNIDESVIRRPGSGLDRVQQVLVNHSPIGRAHWRLKPFIDCFGRVFASSLISVRPLDSQLPLEYLWALCASPLAQFYCYSFLLKRNIHTGMLGSMPIPKSDTRGILRITNIAKKYIEAAKKPRTLMEQDGTSPSKILQLLREMDAEILRLYDLPAHAERLMLDQFAKERRPGIPVTFTSYYPDDFKADVPLYVFLSKTFQEVLRGKTPELTSRQEERYDRLTEKMEAGSLTDKEAEDLHQLQAEVDGRDYALQMLSSGKPKKPTSNWFSIDSKLKNLADRLASESLRRARKSL